MQNGMVWIYSCHTDDKTPGHQNQQWVWDNTKKTITNPQSSQVLDALNNAKVRGTPVETRAPNGGANQQWAYNATDSSIRGVGSGLCLDVGSAVPRGCDADENKALPFCNVNLGMAARVRDLVNRIPQAEKWGLFGNNAAGVASLLIPRYQWWSEALHGVGGSPGVKFGGTTPSATSFPQVCVTGATFDRTLWHEIGDAISTEARAFHSVGNAGLTFWAPNLNIFRDPRWGRGQETPGEDPFHTSQYVKYFVTGMQGNTSYLKVSSCCKHFVAYSLDDWKGVDRCSFNAVVTPQDLTDTYLPGFESCVSPMSGGGSSIMCSYNAVNGIPMCANENLLTATARNKWGFNGYITGDCEAVRCVQTDHHYTNNSDATCSAVLEAGLDIDCGTFLPQNLAKAVTNGKVSMDLVNSHLYNLFMVQFRLGMFDPEDRQPYMKITPSSINTPAHQQLALTAALEGIVLLKNTNNVVPLAKGKKVALIGPFGQATKVLLGNYEGNPPFIVSPQAGIAKFASSVVYSQGSDVSSKNTNLIQAACDAAAAAEQTIIIAGLDQTQEREGHDRDVLTWPGVQEQMILKVASCSKTPVVLVIFGGGPIDITQEKSANSIGAIFWAGYAGQAGGDAIAKILYGDVSPSGRLPHTVYPANFVDQVPETDMGMRPKSGNPGRTYRFYSGMPIYEYGTGLSYTTFTIQWSNTSTLTIPQDKVNAIVTKDSYSQFEELPLAGLQAVVTNTGKVTSDVVVLAFVVGPNPGKDGNPIKRLAGFERVRSLAAGQKVTVNFSVTAQDLSYTNSDGKLQSQRGTWKFVVENSVVPIQIA